MNKWRERLSTWDAQQDLYRPDREHALGAMTDAIASALPVDRLRVLDLACGCGAVTARILYAVPSAHVVGIDRDPVLLRIAREIWAGDPRVAFEQADLRDSAWAARHGVGRFDAVVTAASTHWFDPDDLSSLYRVIARSLRPGGLFANLDWIPISPSHFCAVAILASSSLSVSVSNCLRTSPVAGLTLWYSTGLTLSMVMRFVLSNP
jgi:SAM-dependent methyltransferase